MKINFKVLSIILIFCAVLVAYGQLLHAYFWHDDYTNIYQAQRGLAFEYPYQSMVLLLKIPLSIFGLNPFYYHLLAIFLYFFSTVLIYFLAKTIFKKELLAIISSLIFASGYVGIDAFYMFLADGLTTLVGMILFLSALLIFLNYLKGKNKKIISFVAAAILTFLALEVAPQRIISLPFILIAADWIYSSKKIMEYKKIIVRNAVLLSIFIIQYEIHPLSYIFHYSTNITRQIYFEPTLPLVLLGSFWNLIFPYKLYLDTVFFNNGVAFAIFSSVLLLLALYLKKMTLKKLIIYLIVYILSLYIAHTYVLVFQKGSFEQFSLFHGLGIILFFATLLFLRIPDSARNATFSLIFAFGLLSVFPLSGISYPLESSNRYLLTSLMAVPFITSFIITRDIYNGRRLVSKIISWSLFIIPSAVIIATHFLSGMDSQKKFIEKYSSHAQRIYSQIKSYIGNPDLKVLIYIDTPTNDLYFIQTDSQRVGRYGSEAAYAVHFNTNLDKILLPDTMSDIPSVIKQNPDLLPTNIYTFMYDGNNLKDTSQITRQLLQKKNAVATITGQKMLKIPEGLSIQALNIQSQLPIELKIQIKTNNLTKVKLNWQYDIERTVTIEKNLPLNLRPDNEWHEYSIKIPAAGVLLKDLEVLYTAPGRFEVGRISYQYSI